MHVPVLVTLRRAVQMMGNDVRNLIYVVAAFGLLVLGNGCRSWGTREAPIEMIGPLSGSANGDFIAFSVHRGDGSEPDQRHLCILGVGDLTSTSSELDITVNVIGPAWAPDGTHLLYATLDQSLAKFDIATRETVTLSPPDCTTPKYFPDGKTIGFVRDAKLVVQDLSSGRERVLGDRVGRWYWCWSRTGDKAYFARRREIVESSAEGGTGTVLYRESSTNRYDTVSSLTLSPDGQHLGFYRSANHTFYTLDLASHAVEPQFTCSHYFRSFTWVPDGIIYLDAEGGERRRQARLMKWQAATGNTIQIASGPFSFPVVLPNGKVVVRAGSREIWEVDGDSGESRKLWGPSGSPPEECSTD